MDDIRFVSPLHTVAEAARIIDVPPSTLHTWVRGYLRRPAGRPQVIGKPVVTQVQVDSGPDAVPGCLSCSWTAAWGGCRYRPCSVGPVCV